MSNKKNISHVEIYFEDSSMERIYNCNERTIDKKFTKKQVKWIIEEILNQLNGFLDYSKSEEVTVDNYKNFDEDSFSNIPHSEFQMLISLLDVLSGD